jgi:ATP-dependent Clp protease adaptor protein ClpS
MIGTTTKPKIKDEVKVERPRLHKVILTDSSVRRLDGGCRARVAGGDRRKPLFRSPQIGPFRSDDFTPREFVVTVLRAEFHMTEDQALRVMMTAHRRGACVVAVFTKDVAEAKATNATDAGRRKGYPLLFTTEPEE